jgi:hypothetical protein
VKSEILKDCISKIYSSQNRHLLKIVLEKYLDLKISENSHVAFRYIYLFYRSSLARLQAIDAVSYLRQAFLSFRKAAVNHPMVDILRPWMLRFTQVHPEDLCIFFS